MGIFELLEIGTDSHYEKSIAQAAAKVKSFLITYGCEFPEIKKKALVGGSDQVEPGNEIIFKQDSVFLKFYT